MSSLLFMALEKGAQDSAPRQTRQPIFVAHPSRNPTKNVREICGKAGAVAEGRSFHLLAQTTTQIAEPR
jgi:hypothetical protein